MQMETLATELSTFQHHKDEWVRHHAGRFVVIQDEIVAEGFHESYADAVRAGVQRFGAQRSFLVKEIRATEPIYFFSA